MDQVRNDAGPVSRPHRRREPRYLARHELPDGADAGRREDRQRDLSVREGAEVTDDIRRITPPGFSGEDGHRGRNEEVCNAPAYFPCRLLSATGLADRPRQAV